MKIVKLTLAKSCIHAVIYCEGRPDDNRRATNPTDEWIQVERVRRYLIGAP